MTVNDCDGDRWMDPSVEAPRSVDDRRRPTCPPLALPCRSRVAAVPRRRVGRRVPVPADRLTRGRARLGGRDPPGDRGRRPPRRRRTRDVAGRSGPDGELPRRRRPVLCGAVHPDRHRDHHPAGRLHGTPERRDAAVHGGDRRRLHGPAHLAPSRRPVSPSVSARSSCSSAGRRSSPDRPRSSPSRRDWGHRRATPSRAISSARGCRTFHRPSSRPAC